MFLKLRRIHLVGIGGTGMNGIAEVLLNLGYSVTGSDLQTNPATRRLKRLGALIHRGHSGENVGDADVVVTSSAVGPDNVEVREARRRRIPVIPRAEMLAELMRMKLGIAVAGSHGKTTTTSMVAHVLEAGGFDPTIIVGGRLNTVGAHAKLGAGDFIVAEADESDRSFLYLSPFIALLTNIDREHLDQYQSLEELQNVFVRFANKVPFYSPVILCLDDPHLQTLIPRFERRIITYGFSAQAEFTARDHLFKGFSSSSTVFLKDRELGMMKLNVPGKHNILNALAAVAVGLELEIPAENVLKALENFSGTGRRFEMRGEVNGVLVIEDYAHHPTEIRATLEAARKGWARRVVAVFQPHRYSRLSFLLPEFATSFNQADVLVVTEIYAAGEPPLPGVDGRVLFEEILRLGHKDAHFEPDLKKIPSLVRHLVSPGDILIFLGAGSISKALPETLRLLKGKKNP
ncbi:MAG: UDP-N-acetylmuramate--L-alanine ligase [Candidatus Aminicenantes bacterium]|nr:UDP-N-acetylmuramate--L-alanine ligase [Candidatus Aminicenantes bacterium]